MLSIIRDEKRKSKGISGTGGSELLLGNYLYRFANRSATYAGPVCLRSPPVFFRFDNGKLFPVEKLPVTNLV